MNHWGPAKEQLLQLAKTKGFLGGEFLTWLWYKAEYSSKGIKISPPHQEEIHVTVWVDDRLALQSVHSATESLFKGGSPSQTQEAIHSLLSGKTVKELRLGLQLEHIGDITLNLNAKDLTPRQIQLPELAHGEEDPLQIRLQYIEIIKSTLDQLFALFVKERIDESWQQEGPKKLKEWVREKSLKAKDAVYVFPLETEASIAMH